MPRIIYGPNGIWDDKFLDLLINDGKDNPKAIMDDRNNTKGIETQPNQNPIADNSLASPKPIPSLFLTFLYTKIINHIIKYPITPPINELIWFGNKKLSKLGSNDFIKPININGNVKEFGIMKCFRSIKKIITKKILSIISNNEVMLIP